MFFVHKEMIYEEQRNWKFIATSRWVSGRLRH